MPTPRKFHGPCLQHKRYQLGCGHCNSWRQTQAYQRKPGCHDVPIYRELHWPAPEYAHG